MSLHGVFDFGYWDYMGAIWSFIIPCRGIVWGYSRSFVPSQGVIWRLYGIVSSL